MRTSRDDFFLSSQMDDVCVDHTQPATLFLIEGNYSTMDMLPAMQARRDANIGSFSIKHYAKNPAFFDTALQKALHNRDGQVTAVFMDEKNDIAFVKALGVATEVESASIVADCNLLVNVMGPRPKYIC